MPGDHMPPMKTAPHSGILPGKRRDIKKPIEMLDCCGFRAAFRKIQVEHDHVNKALSKLTDHGCRKSTIMLQLSLYSLPRVSETRHTEAKKMLETLDAHSRAVASFLKKMTAFTGCADYGTYSAQSGPALIGTLDDYAHRLMLDTTSLKAAQPPSKGGGNQRNYFHLLGLWYHVKSVTHHDYWEDLATLSDAALWARYPARLRTDAKRSDKQMTGEAISKQIKRYVKQYPRCAIPYRPDVPQDPDVFRRALLALQQLPENIAEGCTLDVTDLYPSR